MNNPNSILSRLRIVRVAACLALVLVVWNFLPSGARKWTGDMAHDLRVRADEKFQEIAASSETFAKLSATLKDLPSAAIFAKDQKDRTREMRRQLENIRELLLPREALGLVGEIDRLDLAIEKAEASDGSDKSSRLLELRTSRRTAFRKLQTELRHIGLETKPVQDAAVAVLTSEARTLMENAVVAKSAECIVEALRVKIQPESMSLKDARRYYGMYLAMIEVQLVCYDQYLAKSKAEWLPELDLRESESENRSSEFFEKAAHPDCTEEKRTALRKMAGRENKIAATIRREREGLLRRAEAIEAKRAKAAENADIARDAYEQVEAIADLVKLISDMDAEFQSLSELEIPTLSLFTDAQLLSELDGTASGTGIGGEDAE